MFPPWTSTHRSSALRSCTEAFVGGSGMSARGSCVVDMLSSTWPGKPHRSNLGSDGPEAPHVANVSIDL